VCCLLYTVFILVEVVGGVIRMKDELPEWTLPYVNENYTGPFLSDGKYQSSVPYGKTPPSSKLDSFSRLHDTDYYYCRDLSCLDAADERYLQRTSGMSFVPRIIGQIPKYFHKPKFRGNAREAFPMPPIGGRNKMGIFDDLKYIFNTGPRPIGPLEKAWVLKQNKNGFDTFRDGHPPAQDEHPVYTGEPLLPVGATTYAPRFDAPTTTTDAIVHMPFIGEDEASNFAYHPTQPRNEYYSQNRYFGKYYKNKKNKKKNRIYIN
jgi:hypothetical protein